MLFTAVWHDSLAVKLVKGAKKCDKPFEESKFCKTQQLTILALTCNYAIEKPFASLSSTKMRCRNKMRLIFRKFKVL